MHIYIYIERERYMCIVHIYIYIYTHTHTYTHKAVEALPRHPPAPRTGERSPLAAVS